MSGKALSLSFIIIVIVVHIVSNIKQTDTLAATVDREDIYHCYVLLSLQRAKLRQQLLLLMLKSKPAGAELREQVAYLRREYESVGDQLEQEQSRATQVSLPAFFFCAVSSILFM